MVEDERWWRTSQVDPYDLYDAITTQVTTPNTPDSTRFLSPFMPAITFIWNGLYSAHPAKRSFVMRRVWAHCHRFDLFRRGPIVANIRHVFFSSAACHYENQSTSQANRVAWRKRRHPIRWTPYRRLPLIKKQAHRNSSRLPHRQRVSG